MKRIRIFVAYDGTNYCGWQVQPNAPTICGAVQDAVERLFGERGELTGCSRKKSSLVNLFLIAALSMPCVLGFNVWSGFQPLGAGTGVLDLEDFLVSNLLLPIGSLVYLLFCVSKWGWGFDKYVAEANKGKGLKFAKWLKPYFQFILPALIVVIFLQGLL